MLPLGSVGIPFDLLHERLQVSGRRLNRVGAIKHLHADVPHRVERRVAVAGALRVRDRSRGRFATERVVHPHLVDAARGREPGLPERAVVAELLERRDRLLGCGEGLANGATAKGADHRGEHPRGCRCGAIAGIGGTRCRLVEDADRAGDVA